MQWECDSCSVRWQGNLDDDTCWYCSLSDHAHNAPIIILFADPRAT